MHYQSNSLEIITNYNWYIISSTQETYIKSTLKILSFLVLSFYLADFILLIVVTYAIFRNYNVKNINKLGLVIGTKNIYLFIQNNNIWQNAEFESGYILAGIMIISIKYNHKNYHFFLFKYKINNQIYQSLKKNIHYCMFYSQIKLN